MQVPLPLTSFCMEHWFGCRNIYKPQCHCPLLTPLPVQVTFDQDVIISVENEYEVLQLLMGDLRDRCVKS